MANIKWLQDFYNWATTVPETKPMVYAPPVNKQSSDVGVSSGGYSKPANTAPKTTTAATSTNKTIDPTAGMNEAGLALYNSLLKNASTVGEKTPQGSTGGQQIIYSQPQYDPMDYINEMKEAQRQARIASLDKARAAALGSLDTEKANVAPIYYDKRNQAAAASDVGAMNFANYMAARGIKGMAGVMPEIYRQAGLQGQIGALDRQEAGNLAAIEKQRSMVEQGYASDLAAAEGDIESQAMQAAIDQYNMNRDYNIRQAAQDLDQQQFDWSKSSSNPEYQAQILANKARELENTAQEIQNSYLPETLKMEAERLRQQVKAGSLDYDTALAQLNQIKAQTSATNALANQRNETGVDTRTSATNYYALTAELNKAQNKQEAMALLQANADQLSDSDYRRALDYINSNIV